MNKSILLASLLAAVALTACSKKEEPVVEAPPAVVTPAPDTTASAPATPAMDAASAVADTAASAASQ